MELRAQVFRSKAREVKQSNYAIPMTKKRKTPKTAKTPKGSQDP